jgi:hypothetical protein
MTPNGTNPLYNEYTLTWMSLNQTDRNTVIAALQSGYGCDYYTWTRPGDSSDTKWIILSDSSGGVVLYDEIIEEAGFYRITVHLRQIP